MASKYLYKIAADGTQEYTTIAAAKAQADADWGTNTIDADVIFRFYQGTFDEYIYLPDFTMRARCHFSVIFDKETGTSPIISCGVSTFNFDGSNIYWNQTIYRNLDFVNPAKTNKNIRGGTVAYVWVLMDGCTFKYTGDLSTNNLCAAIHPWGTPIIINNCYFEGVAIGGNGTTYIIMQYCKWYIPTSAVLAYYENVITGYSLFYFEMRYCIFKTEAVMSTARGFIISAGSARERLIIDHCIFDGISRLWYDWNNPSAIGQAGNVEVTNTIFINVTDSVFRFSDWDYEDLANMVNNHAMIIEANLFYNCVGITQDYDYGADATLARLQALGFDKHRKCQIADPKFVDASIMNYRIQSTSPAKRAGTLGRGLYYDYYGNINSSSGVASIGVDSQYDNVVAVYPSAANVLLGSGLYGPNGNDYTPTFDKDAYAAAYELARNTLVDVAKYTLGEDIFQFGLHRTGTFDKDAYAAAYELARNTLINLALIVKGTDVFQFGSHRTGTFDEAGRNTDPGVDNVKLATTYKHLNVTKTGTNRQAAPSRVLKNYFYGPSDIVEGQYEATPTADTDDMLEEGALFLDEMLLAHASREISYYRGTAHVAANAVINRNPMDIMDESGVVIHYESIDFLVKASDLFLGDAVSLPQRGDKIKDTRGNTTYVYEVTMPGGMAHYKYDDHAKTLLRIHTKLVGEE